MKPLPLTDGAFFISNSFLETLQTCSRAAEYSKLDLRVINSANAAQTFGGHLHSAFEMHNRLQEYNLSRDEISSRVANLLEQEFQKTPTPEDDFRSYNWALEIYKRFADRWQEEEFSLMKYKEPQNCKYCDGLGQANLGTTAEPSNNPCPWCNATGLSSIMAEVGFAVKLYDAYSEKTGDVPIYYHGFIDLPVSFNGRLHPLDYKTTALLGPSFWDDKKMSAQPKGYAWAMQELLGQQVSGYIVRAIRVNEPPKYVMAGKPNKMGELVSLEKWWGDALTEERYSITQEELVEWKANTIDLIEEFFWHYNRGYFPKKTMWCSGKYGKCQYFDVCSTFPAEDRAQVLYSGLYKNKETNIQIQ
jgi:hypothetical protein